MEMNFCRRCGTKLTHTSGEAYVCENGHRLYTNAAPTAGIFFVTDDNQVLLTIRGIEPKKGMLDTPGGFVDAGETVEQALARELVEELELTDDQYETPQFLCTATNNYSYDGEDRAVLSMLYWSKLKPSANPVARDDVAGIKTMHLADINIDDIGGDDIKTGMKKLQELLLK